MPDLEGASQQADETPVLSRDDLRYGEGHGVELAAPRQVAPDTADVNWPPVPTNPEPCSRRPQEVTGEERSLWQAGSACFTRSSR